MKKIAILGSTGSIGTQTVDILPSIDAEVVALTTNRRINLLEEQARALHPKMVCAMDESAAKELKIKLADTDITVLTGMDLSLIHIFLPPIFGATAVMFSEPRSDVVAAVFSGCAAMFLLPKLVAKQCCK